MLNRYSIAEARNRFAALVRGVEKKVDAVEVTRRGKTVAVILSIDEYHRLRDAAKQKEFWHSYQMFRQQWAGKAMDVEGDIWEGVRDKDAGRAETIWR